MASSTVLETDFLTANDGNMTMIAVPYSVPAPSVAQGIANKGYVDGRSHGTYRTTSGELNLADTGSAFASTTVAVPAVYHATGVGNYVTLQIAPIPLTAVTTTTNIIKGGPIPAAYRPTQTVTRLCAVYMSSTETTMGELSVDSLGYVRVTCPLLNQAYYTFTAGGVAGFPGLSISYIQA